MSSLRTDNLSHIVDFYTHIFFNWSYIVLEGRDFDYNYFHSLQKSLIQELLAMDKFIYN